MKAVLYWFALLPLLTLHACQTDSGENAQENDIGEVDTNEDPPVKMIEYLVGEWEMESGDSDISPSQVDLGERLVFTTEARYISYDGGEKVDSGAYRMNEQLNNIYLESEVDENPREYEVDLQPERLMLTPNQNNSAAGDDTIVYRRVGPASIPPDKSDDAQDAAQD